MSETAKCRWCRLPIREVLSDGSAYWTTGNSRTYVGCPANANGHEPAEPVAEPPAPPEIPADLKADYRDCVNWHNGSYIKGLIERIAALEGKRA